MKKSLILGTAAVALVAAMAPAFSASAASENATIGNSTKNVEVGTVDETVYSVDIDWDDLVFDWEYNGLKNGFFFSGAEYCSPVHGIGDTGNGSGQPLDYLALIGNLYAYDSVPGSVNCVTPVDVNSIVSGTTYSYLAPGPHNITVRDTSENGRFKVQGSFAAEEDYSWVKGVFADAGVGAFPEYSFANNEYWGYVGAEGPFVPVMGALGGKNNYAAYDIGFFLDVNRDVEFDPSSVTAGDKIGTLTLTIEPDYY